MCARPSRSTSLSPTALWQWKGMAHSTALLVHWERSCLLTIRSLPTRRVRGSWVSNPTELPTSARARNSWAIGTRKSRTRLAVRSDRVFDAGVVRGSQTTALATGVPAIRLGVATHSLCDPRSDLRPIAGSRCGILPPLARSEHADHAAHRDSGVGIGAWPDP